VGGGGGTLSVGVFRADAAAVTVSPSSLTLRSGEQQALQFGLSNAAPQGGLLLDVTTDAPESVIHAEVVVPEGATNVVVIVQGGKPGTWFTFPQRIWPERNYRSRLGLREIGLGLLSPHGALGTTRPTKTADVVGRIILNPPMFRRCRIRTIEPSSCGGVGRPLSHVQGPESDAPGAGFRPAPNCRRTATGRWSLAPPVPGPS